MGKSMVAKQSEIVFDGVLTIQVSSGLASFATSAVDNLGNFVAGCDLTVVGAFLYVEADPTQANSDINVLDDSDNVLFNKNIQNIGVGFHDLTDDAGWASKAITRGEMIRTKLDAVASAVGSACLTLQLAPTVSHG